VKIMPRKTNIAKKKKKSAKKSTKLYPQKVKMTPNSPGMGDLTKMAMDGAVLAGAVGMIPMVGGMMSAAMPKKVP
jgi:hypothetical protein